MAEMIYNSTGWLPLGGECMTGCYRFELEGQKCFSWFTNDELVFATYVDQLVTVQLLNRLDELEHLHIPKTMLSVLLNDGKTGGEVMNSIWYTKQPNLRLMKQKPLHTALWTRPKNPPANIIQIGGHSMETVRNIMHGVFLQYQVGTHSYERVNFLTFESQYHPKEQPKETRARYHTELEGRVHLMELMQPLVRSKYMKLLMGMQ